MEWARRRFPGVLFMWQAFMEKFILAKKIGMTRLFSEEGTAIPVTVVEAGPCLVTGLRKADKDGYQAVQLSFGQRRIKKVSKPNLKRLEKVKDAGQAKGKNLKIEDFSRHSREFRVSDSSKFSLGEIIKVDIFKEGDKLKVSSLSKGKGFQGVVKRYGFAGGPKSHGQKDRLRAPGSIGATTPARVIKGRKMPGRMGGKRTTVKNLKAVKVDVENNLLAIKGAVPGRKGTLLEIRG